MAQDQLDLTPQDTLALSAAMRRPLTDLFTRIRAIAAHEEMLTPYLRQELEVLPPAWLDAAFLRCVVLGGGLLLTALLCVWQKAPLHLDGGMLTVYAALAALLLFTYWHPVHRSLKRVLRPL